MNEYKKVVAPIEEIGAHFNELQRKKEEKELIKKISTSIILITFTPILFIAILIIGLGTKKEK